MQALPIVSIDGLSRHPKVYQDHNNARRDDGGVNWRVAFQSPLAFLYNVVFTGSNRGESAVEKM